MKQTLRLLSLALVVLAMLPARGTSIWVNGNKITGSTTISTGGGTVTYDATSKVLTLNNVVFSRSGSDNNGIDNDDVEGLRIVFTGTNSMTINNASVVIPGNNSVIEVAGGTTTFKCTATNQNAIALYGDNVTVRGAGKLVLESTNGPAIQGREGSSNSIGFAIKECEINSGRNDLYNLSNVYFFPSSSTTTTRGIDQTTKITLKAHSNTNYAHASGVSGYRPQSGSNITIKSPTYGMVFSSLATATNATKEFVITDETNASNLTDYQGYLYGLVYEGGTTIAQLVGPSVNTKYTKPTTANIPGYAYVGSAYFPVRICSEAFSGMTSLTAVTLDYGVRDIFNYAFMGCTSLKELRIPSSVRNIGTNIIYNTAVNKIYWATLDPNAVSVNADAFNPNNNTLPSARTLYLSTQQAYSRADNTKFTKYFTRTVDGVEACDFKTDYLAYVATKEGTASNSGEMSLVSGVYLNPASPWRVSLTASTSSYYHRGGDTYGGNNAYYYCTGIAPYAFYNRDISQFTIDYANVKTIGAYAFQNCTGLISVDIGTGMTSIASTAFSNCTALQTVNWNAVNYPDIAQGQSPLNPPSSSIKTVNFGNSVQRIPAHLCVGTSLTQVTIPNSVTTIGDYAFGNCSKMTAATIGTGVTLLASNAFYQCTALTTVNWNAKACSNFTLSAYPFQHNTPITSFTFGNQVEAIPAYLCFGLSKLTSVNIPSSVTSIGDNAFLHCDKLANVTFSPNLKTIGNGAFKDSGITRADLSATALESVGNDLFDNCTALTTVELPGTLTALSNNMFKECTALESITIPETLTTIGDQAFYTCSALKSVTLPPAVTGIGHSAFFKCQALENMSSYPDCQDITLGSDVFGLRYGTTEGCTLHVRPSQLKAYKTADQWKEFFNIVGDLEGDDTNPLDVNGDGDVNVGDVNYVLNLILTEAYEAQADVNNDDAVNVGDVNVILSYILENS